MRKPKVFITQEDNRKNFLPAAEYGELVFVLPAGDQVFMNSGPTIKAVRTALRDFQDGDFILPVGDPVGIGIVCTEAARVNDGKYSQLKFDRQSSRSRGIPVYYPVPCNHA
tara:strand:+ start:2784 stop:3116 length:333 start_codon:yes stop_codon:yes gene_type:complete